MAAKKKTSKNSEKEFWNPAQTKSITAWLKSEEGQKKLLEIFFEETETTKRIKKMNTIDREILLKPYTI